MCFHSISVGYVNVRMSVCMFVTKLMSNHQNKFKLSKLHIANGSCESAASTADPTESQHNLIFQFFQFLVCINTVFWMNAKTM